METSPRTRPGGFWLVTGLLAFGMLAGGTAQLLRLPFNVDGMRHLGYPLYVLSLVGAWKLVGMLVILLPGWRLAKEWAYAGFFFLLTGAAVSHLASGDGLGGALAPIVFACLTAASWQLRPASRRLAPRAGAADTAFPAEHPVHLDSGSLVVQPREPKQQFS